MLQIKKKTKCRVVLREPGECKKLQCKYEVDTYTSSSSMMDQPFWRATRVHEQGTPTITVALLQSASTGRS
jgi:hypothetical protein